MAYKRKRSGSASRNVRRKLMRRRKRSRYGVRGRSNIARICKSVILKTAEPKQKTVAIAKTDLYHNTFHVHQINYHMNMPGEGDNESERVGDRINTGGYLLRFLIAQQTDRPNCTFRYYVVSTNKGNVYNYSTFFLNLMSNILLDSPNKDYVTVHKSGYIRTPKADSSYFIGANGASREKTMPFKLWVPWKKLLKFGPGQGATIPQEKDLYLLIGAFDAYGTLITDIVGYFHASQTLYYKDP